MAHEKAKERSIKGDRDLRQAILDDLARHGRAWPSATCAECPPRPGLKKTAALPLQRFSSC